MDGHRFDDLTRSLGNRSSRRRVIGGLLLGSVAGLVGGIRGTKAQESTFGTVPLGGTCTSSLQCSQDPQFSTAAICADNGITGDGSLNCCKGAGGCCGTGAECCGRLLCLPTGDGRCSGICGDGDPTGTAPTEALALGAACTSTDQCVNTFGGRGYCDSNGIEDDGPLNCCRYDGGLCSTDLECCGAALCVPGASIYGGVCRTPGFQVEGSLLPPGATCTSDASCDQSGGATSCLSNGIGVDGEANCCRFEGGSCSSGSGCCNALRCVAGVCQ